MADDFDRLLADRLVPLERDADRAFVARVQARIGLEERFGAERRSLIRDLMQQLVALLAVGAGAWWLGRSAPVAAWAIESPATALAILLAAFMFAAAMFITRTGPGNLRDRAL
jgi:hypothetical protein